MFERREMQIGISTYLYVDDIFWRVGKPKAIGVFSMVECVYSKTTQDKHSIVPLAKQAAEGILTAHEEEPQHE